MYKWDWILIVLFTGILWVITKNIDTAFFYAVISIVIFAMTNIASHTLDIKKQLEKQNSEVS